MGDGEMGERLANRPVWDHRVLDRHTAGDAELRTALLEAFLTEAPRRREAMLAASVRDDFLRIAAEAHALRGSAAMIGGERLREVCEALVEAARATQPGRTGTLVRLLDDGVIELMAVLGREG